MNFITKIPLFHSNQYRPLKFVLEKSENKLVKAFYAVYSTLETELLWGFYKYKPDYSFGRKEYLWRKVFYSKFFKFIVYTVNSYSWWIFIDSCPGHP